MRFEKYKYETPFSFGSKFKRLSWDIVYLCFFRSNPSWILNGWRIFLLRFFGATIGKGCIVYPSCKVWAPWNLEMGSYSVLGKDVDCYSMDKIKIGSKVAISQRAFLCTGSHSISSLKRPLITAPIVINDHVWVCAQAFVGPGCELGEGVVVAANCVVVKSVSEWSVIAGNPGTVVKKRVIK